MRILKKGKSWAFFIFDVFLLYWTTVLCPACLGSVCGGVGPVDQSSPGPPPAQSCHSPATDNVNIITQTFSGEFSGYFNDLRLFSIFYQIWHTINDRHSRMMFFVAKQSYKVLSLYSQKLTMVTKADRGLSSLNLLSSLIVFYEDNKSEERAALWSAAIWNLKMLYVISSNLWRWRLLVVLCCLLLLLTEATQYSNVNTGRSLALSVSSSPSDWSDCVCIWGYNSSEMRCHIRSITKAGELIKTLINVLMLKSCSDGSQIWLRRPEASQIRVPAGLQEIHTKSGDRRIRAL